MIAAVILAVPAALMFGYGPAFYAIARRQQKPTPPRCRLSSEWSRLQACVAQARAEIDAEAEHFEQWEAEAESTRIHDRLACESIEREEGWS